MIRSRKLVTLMSWDLKYNLSCLVMVWWKGKDAEMDPPGDGK